jgi:hypothetical protein
MPLRSVLEREVPPSQESELRLQALRAQSRDYAIGALVGIVGAPIAIVVAPQLGVAIAVAAAAAIALCLRSVTRRRGLLALLLRDRGAYEIADVRRAGERFANPARRHRLGAWLRSLVKVADAEGVPASLNLRAIDERVRPRRERFLRIADALEADERSIHPASVALLHQMLTRPPVSPLYNHGLDEDLLDLALHRVEAGVEPG